MKSWKLRGSIVVLVLGLLAVAAFWFQPWRLFTTVEVNETLPTLSASASTSASTPTASETASTEPQVLLQGDLISHEYSTAGRVQILLMPDGSRILRLEGLETSDGPELEVWLTDAPVIDGRDGWHVFDDGEYLSLGALKGNVGDQNYLIPDEVDLSAFSSMSIWCVRFAVSFGAAELS